ncbi:MAG: Exopolyphosphatase [Candidatus Omnitrophica bacterium ADurb.Bin277]|nr:MAG: Exopolyphosphatase [Candidatus Omnitrophica bacterium ADurb.Bin277]
MSDPEIPTKHIAAVIDIGTIAIRMVIAEVGGKNEIRYLEQLQKPVRFGKDVFKTGRLSSIAMRQGINILRDFRSVIDAYGIKKIHAIATSAVREAQNRDNFIDQIYVRAGIEVEVLDGPEENRLQLVAVEHALEGRIDLEKKNCLIVEVGSGSTEMIVMDQGQVSVTRTLPIGSVRLPEQGAAARGDEDFIQRVLKKSIRDITKNAAREVPMERIDTFIALGGDMRFVSQQLLPDTADRFTILERKEFVGFVGRAGKMTPEEIATQYSLDYGHAESLYPALLFYLNFLNTTEAEEIIIPKLSIRDGLLLEMAQLVSGYKRTDVSRQVLNSAHHLGTKYMYDKGHAVCVASLALKLFDSLAKDHGMGPRERLLLEVSGILHDIGTYISSSGHHKHSFYLVDASEIFGLRQTDKNIIANVVRYHRRVPPRETHVPYMSLAKSDRAIVSKLASILRVADALDTAHQQKIRSFALERSEDAYALWVSKDSGDISLERESLRRKGDMFADVFGAPIDLKQGVPPAA